MPRWVIIVSQDRPESVQRQAKTMSRSPIGWIVALDGGTTNTRARLLSENEIKATARRSVGVRDTVARGDRRVLAAAVREAIQDVLQQAGGIRPDAIVAAGMLSSEVGLTVVPHVVAPAGLDELAHAAVEVRIPEVADQAILFIPGVRTPATADADGWAAADIMRGEECETLGAWSLLAGATLPSELAHGNAHAATRTSSVFLWPGSHTKVVEVGPDGKILRSHTTLAGEVTSALARHTIIASHLPEALPYDPDPEALETGMRLVSEVGLGRAAFLVRIAALGGQFDAHQRASFWIGAIVGDDVANLVRHPILASAGRGLIGGRQPQRALYAAALRKRHPRLVSELSDEIAETASAIGALAVLRVRQTLLNL
jgi:2-dehydro-3-deoxygalactonokinase